MRGVRAHLVKGVRSAITSDDQKYGLLGFERERPDSNGDELIWIGVPIHNLPMVSVAAVRAIPQPESPTGKHPAVFRAEAVTFGKGDESKLLLKVEFQPGADLSMELDKSQARALMEGIQVTLGLGGPDRPRNIRPN